MIVTVGGKADGDQFTEAEAGGEYLSETGVPSDALLAVPEGVRHAEEHPVGGGGPSPSGAGPAPCWSPTPGTRCGRSGWPRTPASTPRSSPTRPGPAVLLAHDADQVHPPRDRGLPALPRDRRERRRCAGDRLRRAGVLELGRIRVAGHPRWRVPVLRRRHGRRHPACVELEGSRDGRGRRPRSGCSPRRCGVLTARRSVDPEDAARYRARAGVVLAEHVDRRRWTARGSTSREPSMWTDRAPVPGRRAAGGRERHDGRLVTSHPTLTADDRLSLDEQVFLLWLEVVLHPAQPGSHRRGHDRGRDRRHQLMAGRGRIRAADIAEVRDRTDRRGRRGVRRARRAGAGARRACARSTTRRRPRSPCARPTAASTVSAAPSAAT